MRYFPAPSVAVSRATLVPTLVAITLAFATTAPVESRTVPVNSADATCAAAGRQDAPSRAPTIQTLSIEYGLQRRGHTEPRRLARIYIRELSRCTEFGRRA